MLLQFGVFKYTSVCESGCCRGRAYLQSAAHQPLSAQAVEIYSAPWSGPIGQAAFYRQIAQMDQIFTDEVESLYDRLDCPVSVLWGQRDEWIPREKGDVLANLISDNECIVVENAGLLVQENSPEAIVAAVLNTIKR